MSDPQSTPTGPNRPEAYQHWMDDAANMGLMLFRMRNDSKREGIVARQREGSGTPPPLRSPPPGASGSPPHTRPPVMTSPMGLTGYQPFRPPAGPDNVTPRTGLALQTPTVATASTGSRTGDSATHHHRDSRRHTGHSSSQRTNRSLD